MKSKQEREAVFAAYQTALLSTQKPSQHLPSKPQQVAQPAAVTVGGEGSKEEKSQKAPQAEEQPAPALSAKDRLVQVSRHAHGHMSPDKLAHARMLAFGLVTAAVFRLGWGRSFAGIALAMIFRAMSKVVEFSSTLFLKMQH